MKKCYSLVIGINDYPGGIGFADLKGSERDAERVESYLKHFLPKRGYELDLLVLKGQQATKAAIVDGFTQHLTKAGAEDIAFFFYSGHGSQEVVHEAFKDYESDGLLETIVCVDSRPYDAEKSTSLKGTDLCDKEMRYLFQQVAKSGAQVVAVYDCCNSGDNTRNFGANEESTKAYPGIVPVARKWEQFVFGDQLKEKEVKDGASLNEVMPEADMIQFSACKSHQYANEELKAGRKLDPRKEVWKKDGEYGGVFINGLLYTLGRSTTGLSYYDLAHRVRSYMSGYKDQTPKLYASNKAQQYLYDGFLGSTPDSKGLYGRVKRVRRRDSGNNPYDEWGLDLGAVHGLPPAGNKVKVEIKTEKGKSVVKVGFRKVSATRSVLDIKKGSSTERKLDPKAFYLGYLTDFYAAPSNFHLIELSHVGKPIQRKTAASKLLKAALDSQKPANVVLSNSSTGSPYKVIARQKEQDYIVSRGDDPDFLPLIKPVSGFGADSASKVMKNLEHIAHWEYVKAFENKSSKFSQPPLKIELVELHSNNQQKAVSVDRDGAYKLSPFRKKDGRPFGAYKLRLTNTASESVFVSILFLDIDFAINPYKSSAISPYEIQAGKSFEKLVFGYPFENHKSYLSSWQIPFRPAYAKLIVATGDLEFDVSALTRDALPPPYGGTRNAASQNAPQDDPDMQRWTTQLVEFAVMNPFYKNA